METPTSTPARGWPAEGSAPIACLGCRRLKMRCVMTGEPPCARCERSGRECVIQPSRRGIQRGNAGLKKDGRRDDRAPASGTRVWGSPAASATYRSASLPGKTGSSSPHDRSHYGQSLARHTSPETPASSDTTSSSGYQHPSRPEYYVNPPIARACIPDETLHDLVGFFREKLLYFIPILDSADLDDISFVVQHRRPLALCTSLVATNFVPGAASIQRSLRGSVSEFLGSIEGSLSADPNTLWTQLQACAVLYAYRASTDVTNPELLSQEEKRLNHWRMKAAIEVFAMRLHLHRSLDEVREMVKRGESQISQTYAFNKATYWLWLFTMSHHFSLVAETPPTIRLDNSIRNACMLLSQINIPARICRMLAEVDLVLLWDRVETQFPGLGEWWCASPETLDCEQATRVLADADNALILWTRRWGVHGVVDPTYPGLDVSKNGAVDYHYRATRFWLQAIAARIVYQQADMSLDHSSPPVQLYIDLVLKSVQAAEHLCQYLLEVTPLTLDSARYMADFGFALIAYCCLYNIRICTFLGDDYPHISKTLTTVELCGKMLSEMAVGSNQMPLIFGKRVLECLGHSRNCIGRDIRELDAGLVLSRCRTDLHWIDHLHS